MLRPLAPSSVGGPWSGRGEGPESAAAFAIVRALSGTALPLLVNFHRTECLAIHLGLVPRRLRPARSWDAEREKGHCALLLDPALPEAGVMQSTAATSTNEDADGRAVMASTTSGANRTRRKLDQRAARAPTKRVELASSRVVEQPATQNGTGLGIKSVRHAAHMAVLAPANNLRDASDAIPVSRAPVSLQR